MTDTPTNAETSIRARLAELRRASTLVDEASDPTEYQTRLIALALLARQFLRETDAGGLLPAPAEPRQQALNEAIAAIEALTDVDTDTLVLAREAVCKLLRDSLPAQAPRGEK